MDLNVCIEVVKLYEGSYLSIIHDLSSEYSIKNNYEVLYFFNTPWILLSFLFWKQLPSLHQCHP